MKNHKTKIEVAHTIELKGPDHGGFVNAITQAPAQIKPGQLMTVSDSSRDLPFWTEQDIKIMEEASALCRKKGAYIFDAAVVYDDYPRAR